MPEYFVFLLQTVQTEGNFFLHEDITQDITRAKKTYEEARESTKELFAHAT